MKKLWLLTLGAFAFQLAIFFGSLPFLAEQGKYGVAITFASAGTIFVMLGALIAVVVTPYRFSAMFASVGVAAFTGTFALALAVLRQSGDFDSAVIAVVVLVVSFIMSYFATFPAMKDDPNKPRWALLITALPLGVGAIVGWPLLFFFTKKNTVRVWSEVSARRSTVPYPGDDTTAEP